MTFVPKEEEVEMKKMVLELDLSMPASKVRIQFPSFTIFFSGGEVIGQGTSFCLYDFYETSFLQVEKLLGRCLGVEPGALRLYKCFSARLSIISCFSSSYHVNGTIAELIFLRFSGA